MRPIKKAAAAGALVALLAPAVAEAAPTDSRTGRFHVTLEGVQRTTWTTDRAAQFECDVNIHGGGTETVRFRSRRAVVTVRALRGLALLTRGRGPATLDLDARITRDGSVATTGSPACADGDGGGGAEPEPDCGTRRSRVSVDVAYMPGRRSLIGFEPAFAALGPFRECPVGGTAWPQLLDRTRGGRPVEQVLPVRELLAHGKSIVVGRGREALDDGESRSTTTIRWELAFTRIGSRARARARSSAAAGRYRGRTNAGDRISFVVRGGRLSALRTSTPVSCVPTEGTPRAGTDLFEPPGRFALGRTVKVQTAEPVETAMHYSPVTKWLHVTARRGKRGAIVGRLHQNYSFQTLATDSWGHRLVGWVCRGDARFTARPRRMS